MAYLKKIFSLFLVLPFIFILSFSCSKPIKEETVKKIVSKYNHSLMLAYREGKFDPLIEVAADKALSMADNAYQAYLSGEGIVLDSELLELTFKKITLGTGEDEPKVKVVWYGQDKEWREIYLAKETFVETTERWRYKWIDAKTGTIASPIMTVKYEMRYKLEVKDGKLKVISTEINEQKVEKKEGDGGGRGDVFLRH